MRFIGNKENLVGKIYQILQSKGISGTLFFDFFAGTSNVGQFFKKKGYQVFSSDLLYFSFSLPKPNARKPTHKRRMWLCVGVNINSNKPSNRSSKAI